MIGSLVRRVLGGAAVGALVAGSMALAAGTAGAITGLSWHPALAPMPAGAATSRQQATLGSVACTKAGVCVASGTYTATGTQQQEVLVRSGGKWIASDVSAITGGGTSRIQSVACTPTSYCVAVGSSGPPLVLVETGGTWTVAAIANATIGTGSGVTIAGCSSTLGCVAFGRGVVVDQVAGVWTATALPLPTGFHGTPGTPQAPALKAVSCTSTNCVATGSSYLGGDPGNYGQGAVVVQGSGTSWTDRAVPLPANAVAYTQEERASLTGVSCVGHACVAVGSYTVATGVLEGLLFTRPSGKTWSSAQAPQPTGSSSGLSAVACTSATACLAVGGFTDTTATGRNLVLTGAAGGPWSASSPAFPTGGTSSNGLTAVACGKPTLCAASGSYRRPGATFPTAQLLAGSVTGLAAAVAAPLPRGTTGTTVNAVSCKQTCVAVGHAGLKTYPYSKNLVETYRG